MGKDIGPVCRFCKREGLKLFLKGERCYTDKCAFDRRNYPPGQHGQRRPKLSDYGIQLREKQKLRRIYGIREKQFKRIFSEAIREKGVTSEVLLQKLELRLDNVVYKMGLASSRNDAKQLISHRHILVNGKKVSIPSMILKVGDLISLDEKDHKLSRIQLALNLAERRPSIPWLDVDKSKLVAKVIALPKREDIQLNVQERLVVELYSK